MANHKSAEKRARQNIKRAARNSAIRSRVKTAIKSAKQSSESERPAALSRAFSVIQKSKGVYHKNAIRRKMSRLARSLAKKTAS